MGPTRPSAQLVLWAVSAGLKRQRRQADHSHLSTAVVKNGEAIPPLSRMSSRRGALLSPAVILPS
jgi:hypothetical protein